MTLWLDVPISAAALADAQATGALHITVVMQAQAVATAAGGAEFRMALHFGANAQADATSLASVHVFRVDPRYSLRVARAPRRDRSAWAPQRNFVAIARRVDRSVGAV